MSFAKDLLAKLLGKFVKGAKGDQLTLRHLLSGAVELGPGVAIAEAAMQQVFVEIGGPLNWEFLGAEADTVHIQVPWAQLVTRSTRVSIGELTVEVLLHDTPELEAALFGDGRAPRSSDSAPVPSPSVSFFEAQRARLQTIFSSRRRKIRAAFPRRRTLAEAVKFGARFGFGSIRFKCYRRDLASKSVVVNPNEVAQALAAGTIRLSCVVEFKGVVVSPCTPDGRPTMVLQEAHGIQEGPHEEELPTLPSGLRFWSTRIMARAESMQVYMPDIHCGELRVCLCMREMVLRMRILEACNVLSQANKVVEATVGRCLGALREVSIGRIDGAASTLSAEGGEGDENGNEAWTMHINEADLREMAELCLQFQAANMLAMRYKREQAWHEKSTRTSRPSQGRVQTPSQASTYTDGTASEADSVGQEDFEDREFDEVLRHGRETVRKERASMSRSHASFKNLLQARRESGEDFCSPQLSIAGEEMYLSVGRSADDNDVPQVSEASTIGSGGGEAAVPAVVLSNLWKDSGDFLEVQLAKLRNVTRGMVARRGQVAVARQPTVAEAEGGKLVMSGVLLKRGQVAFMDSWQERWCELRRVPASSSSAPPRPSGCALLYYKRGRASKIGWAGAAAALASGGRLSGIHAAPTEADGIIASEQRLLRGFVWLPTGSAAVVRGFHDAEAEARADDATASLVKLFQDEFLQGFVVLASSAERFYFVVNEPGDVKRWVSGIQQALLVVESECCPESAISMDAPASAAAGEADSSLVTWRLPFRLPSPLGRRSFGDVVAASSRRVSVGVASVMSLEEFLCDESCAISVDSATSGRFDSDETLNGMSRESMHTATPSPDLRVGELSAVNALPLQRSFSGSSGASKEIKMTSFKSCAYVDATSDPSDEEVCENGWTSDEFLSADELLNEETDDVVHPASLPGPGSSTSDDALWSQLRFLDCIRAECSSLSVVLAIDAGATRDHAATSIESELATPPTVRFVARDMKGAVRQIHPLALPEMMVLKRLAGVKNTGELEDDIFDLRGDGPWLYRGPMLHQAAEARALHLGATRAHSSQWPKASQGLPAEQRLAAHLLQTAPEGVAISGSFQADFSPLARAISQTDLSIRSPRAARSPAPQVARATARQHLRKGARRSPPSSCGAMPSSRDVLERSGGSGPRRRVEASLRGWRVRCDVVAKVELLGAATRFGAVLRAARGPGGCGFAGQRPDTAASDGLPDLSVSMHDLEIQMQLPGDHPKWFRARLPGDLEFDSFEDALRAIGVTTKEGRERVVHRPRRARSSSSHRDPDSSDRALL